MPDGATPVDPDVSLSGALVDVIESLDASITGRLTRLEARLWRQAQMAAWVAMLVGIGLAAAALGWASANLAIGAFVAAREGIVVGAAVVAGINLVVGLACMGGARWFSARAPVGQP